MKIYTEEGHLLLRQTISSLKLHLKDFEPFICHYNLISYTMILNIIFMP